MPNFEKYNRNTTTPIVHRLVSNNVTKDIFGTHSYKVKPCSCCGAIKVYSDFYVKPGFQHLDRNSIGAMHLRDHCVECFDFNNKYVYNKGSRPKPEIGATLETFLNDEDAKNERRISVG